MKKNKILLLIISFIAASVLWVYVVTVVNPEGTRSISGIPVTFSGEDVLREDQNLIITTDYHGDITLEAVSFEQKAAFFEEIFGIRPVLRHKKYV